MQTPVGLFYLLIAPQCDYRVVHQVQRVHRRHYLDKQITASLCLLQSQDGNITSGALSPFPSEMMRSFCGGGYSTSESRDEIT